MYEDDRRTSCPSCPLWFKSYSSALRAADLASLAPTPTLPRFAGEGARSAFSRKGSSSNPEVAVHEVAVGEQRRRPVVEDDAALDQDQHAVGKRRHRRD